MHLGVIGFPSLCTHPATWLSTYAVGPPTDSMESPGPVSAEGADRQDGTRSPLPTAAVRPRRRGRASVVRFCMARRQPHRPDVAHRLLVPRHSGEAHGPGVGPKICRTFNCCARAADLSDIFVASFFRHPAPRDFQNRRRAVGGRGSRDMSARRNA